MDRLCVAGAAGGPLADGVGVRIWSPAVAAGGSAAQVGSRPPAPLNDGTLGCRTDEAALEVDWVNVVKSPAVVVTATFCAPGEPLAGGWRAGLLNPPIMMTLPVIRRPATAKSDSTIAVLGRRPPDTLCGSPLTSGSSACLCLPITSSLPPVLRPSEPSDTGERTRAAPAETPDMAV